MLKASTWYGFRPWGAPDALHGRLADGGRCRYGASAPACGVGQRLARVADFLRSPLAEPSIPVLGAQ